MPGGKKTTVSLAYTMKYAWRPNRSKYLLKSLQYLVKNSSKACLSESPTVTQLSNAFPCRCRPSILEEEIRCNSLSSRTALIADLVIALAISRGKHSKHSYDVIQDTERIAIYLHFQSLSPPSIYGMMEQI